MYNPEPRHAEFNKLWEKFKCEEVPEYKARVWFLHAWKIQEKKIAKLKELMLLTDPVVGHVVVSDVQIIQHQEFLKCFPDELELLETKSNDYIESLPQVPVSVIE